MKKLLFLLNEPTYFISHRLPIAIAAQHHGYEVHVATGIAQSPPILQEVLLHYHYVPLSRSGTHIFSEARTLWRIYRFMKRLKPDIVLLVTTKPVIYGTLAARLAHIPAVVAAISGLGYIFTSEQWRARCLRKFIFSIYRIGFKHPRLKIIFQNKNDQALFLNKGFLQPRQTVLIPGSGVNLTTYHYQAEPACHSTLIVLMAARLLKDKGVMEYIEAARLLKSQGCLAQFWLAGSADLGNPTSIDPTQLLNWQQEGVIKLLGHVTDMPLLLSQVHIVVLPSYREGLPRILSEAAACGRAVITTDVPGCRDAIIPHKTGLLVKAKDSTALAEAIAFLLQHHTLRQAMGKKARAFAEQTFNIHDVVEKHLHIFQTLSQD